MKIWLINHYAVPPEYYALARQTNFAKYLKQMGHEVLIVAASTVHNSSINLIEDKRKYCLIERNGIDYLLVNCHDYTGSGIKRIFNMCEFAVKLPGVCKKFDKPDAIVATSMPPMSCAMGVRLAKKYHCTAIAEIADLWPESLIAYGMAGRHNPAVIWLRHLEKWIYKKADKIVFTMEGAYDYIIEQNWQKDVPREKVEYINNGVDLELFNYNKDNYQIEDADLVDISVFKVIYTGSIRKVNNLGLLLDVAKYVKNEKIKFLIWGDGDELPMLRKRIETEKITNVVFKGRVDKKYVPYITSKADMNFAHNNPSDLFRFGISFNKIFDYFAAGKPILTDFPCPYNPVTNLGAGLQVECPGPENVAKTIDYIAELTEAEYKQYCDHAVAAAEKYDFKELTRLLVKIIVEKN